VDEAKARRVLSAAYRKTTYWIIQFILTLLNITCIVVFLISFFWSAFNL
jgi:hypothetical protein